MGAAAAVAGGRNGDSLIGVFAAASTAIAITDISAAMILVWRRNGYMEKRLAGRQVVLT